MLVKAAENLHENSHLLLWNHEEFPKIYSGRFKWVYLWRCGQGWVFEENQCYKQTFLVFFFFFKESPYLPRLWTHAFPIMCWNGSNRRFCDYGEMETESTAIEED